MNEQPRLTADQRQMLLTRQVQMAVGRGGRVQSQDPVSAVIVYGKPVNHVLHLIITVVTAGLWVHIWNPAGLSGGEKREMITVNEFGQVATQRL